MNFHQYEGWRVAFLEADAQTALPWQGTFTTTDKLYDLVRRSYDAAGAEIALENCLRHWARGTITLRLNAEQYYRLKRPNPRAG